MLPPAEDPFVAMAESHFLLKSVAHTQPDVKIAANETVYIGRTPETGIRDVFVSKQHLKLRAKVEKKVLLVELLGVNPSLLNEEPMERHKEYQVIDGDTIEVIAEKYQYKVLFSSHPNGKAMKRRGSDDLQLPAAKQLKWQVDVQKDDEKASSSWESFNGQQLLVYTPRGCKSSALIAAYDMDGTLITTKSGKVFPTNVDDWKLAFGNVRRTLQEKHSANYKIVIFTNQAGISSGKTKLTDIQKKIEKIIDALGVPVQAFVAAGDNHFRKPLTGMWQMLCDAKNDGVSVDMKASYYVGDAAGRPENKLRKKKKDHSSADRLFAMNLGLPFLTPEEHFSRTKPEKWTKPEFIPHEFLASPPQLVEPQVKIAKSDLEVVVMVGGPGSGKSHFCKTYLQSAGYEIINRDTIGTWQKCVNRLNDCLKSGKKAVIDNTNGNKEARFRYINAAKKNNVSCRCLVMTASFKHCEHNVAFRELVDATHSKISKMVMYTYRKSYQEPSLDEGFSEIVKVNFEPKFSTDKEKALYGMFLLPS